VTGRHAVSNDRHTDSRAVFFTRSSHTLDGNGLTFRNLSLRESGKLSQTSRVADSTSQAEDAPQNEAS
jgi:hypothetical protein